jgi:hypothetical protein
MNFKKVIICVEIILPVEKCPVFARFLTKNHSSEMFFETIDPFGPIDPHLRKKSRKKAGLSFSVRARSIKALWIIPGGKKC